MLVQPFFCMTSFCHVDSCLRYHLVGGFKHVLSSISYMGCHPSHWLIFFRGVGQPPTRLWNNHLSTIYIYIYKQYINSILTTMAGCCTTNQSYLRSPDVWDPKPAILFVGGFSWCGRQIAARGDISPRGSQGSPLEVSMLRSDRFLYLYVHELTGA